MTNNLIKARIFISHSTKSDISKSYLNAVHNALYADLRFFPVLDRQGLRGGDDWRECIYKWMDQAHGAVVLISREALQSSFVPIELSVLSFRAVREQKFPIIPVLLPDVSISDVDQGVIGDIHLKRLQFISGLKPDEAAREVIKRLAEQLEPERRCPRNRHEILLQQLRDSLERANLKSSDLENFSQSVSGWPEIDWSSRSDAYLLFAETLLKVDFEQACRMLCYIREGRPSVGDVLSHMLNLLAPLWVDEKEAQRIGEIALNKDTRLRTFFMRASDSWTVHSYIYRARGCGLDEPIQPCEVGLPETENPEKDVVRYLSKHLTKPTGIRTLLPQLPLSALLEDHEREKRCIFLIFNESQWPITRKLIDRLRSEIATPTYFFFSENKEKIEQEDVAVVVGPKSDYESGVSVKYFNTLQIVTG